LACNIDTANMHSIFGVPLRLQNWVLYPTPDTVTYHHDTSFCQAATVTLHDHHHGVSYEWNTGGTDSVLTVGTAGTYWVIATNACGSEVIDTFHVTAITVPLNLGPDTTICSGVTQVLTPGITGATYLWQDGSAVTSYTVSTAGVYWVKATLSGCSKTDTVHIAYIIPVANLGIDTGICKGDTVTLQAMQAGAAYLWQNGATAPVIDAWQQGVYWVRVTLDGCTKTDSVALTITDMMVNIGNDTALCAGKTVTLNAGVAGAADIWQDGSTGSSFTVSAAGTYVVHVSLNGCIRSDTVVVSYKPNPTLDIGNDTSLCPGQTITLGSAIDGATYVWQDGKTTPLYVVSDSGRYIVQVTLNGCSTADTATVGYPDPGVTLNYHNKNICKGDQFSLIANSIPGSTYQWQNGDTSRAIVVTDAGHY
jgi:hypothetical protein